MPQQLEIIKKPKDRNRELITLGDTEPFKWKNVNKMTKLSPTTQKARDVRITVINPKNESINKGKP